MKVKSISKNKVLITKRNRDLKVGDSVLTPFGKKKVVGVFDQGINRVYRINLTDGTSIRTDGRHFNTVSFRSVNGVSIWENVTTSFIKENLDKFNFNFPTTQDVLNFSKDNESRVSSCGEYLDLTGNWDPVSLGELSVSSIDDCPDENTRCIKLDYDLGLYYTGEGIITHNTTLSTLDNLFTTVNLFCMRNPKRFFGLAASTSIVQAFISFSMDKAAQLLLQPFMQILQTSPKFLRVKQEEHLAKRQRENPDKICWTTAGRIGALQFPQDIHYILASGPHQLLGLNMIKATLSEISFFIDRGFSPEYIWRIFQDSKGRIQSRFGEDKRFCGVILDSSPNDLDASPIDKYIFTGESKKDPLNYVVTGSQWEMFEQDPNLARIKEIYPKYYATKETFPVFRGNASSPADILNESTLGNYSKDEIYDVPIDLKMKFIENCTKSVKDFCGWPAGSQDKLIREHSLIEDIFAPQLKNIPTFIYAPSTQSATELIWNQIRDKFFVKTTSRRYEFYRAPREKRWLHFDQSETGDVTGIVMSHPEWDLVNSQIVVVHDFTLVISPGRGRINLDAFRLLPEDLRDKGSLDIEKITFDQYQSSTTIQYLKEKGFNAERWQSFDTDTRPYLTYVSLVNTGRVKAGRNIFLKNNLKSIQEVKTDSGKTKIDHMIGKIVNDDGGRWEDSLMGINAKDVSDAAAATAFLILHEYKGKVPRYTWEDVKIDINSLDNPLEKSKVTEEFKIKFREQTLKNMENRINFKVKELR